MIEPTKVGQRGTHYRVLLSDGAELIPDTRCPEYDACRALLAKGITGKVETWVGGIRSMVLDIAKAAKWTVSEEDAKGLRLKAWKPYGEDIPSDAPALGEGVVKNGRSQCPGYPTLGAS